MHPCRHALAAVLVAAGAHAQAQVGVSVQVNQPGLYGRIDIGGLPPAIPAPLFVYPQPVVIVPGPVAVHQRPIYLHVPPGYERHWERHCAEYRACGQPVYFVRDDWYREHYVHHLHEQERMHDQERIHEHERMHAVEEHHEHGHEHDRGPHGHGDGQRRD